MAKTLTAPVFRPTLEHVRNKTFEEYVEEIEPQFADVGVCRIVAPEGWTPRRGGYEDVDFLLPRYVLLSTSKDDPDHLLTRPPHTPHRPIRQHATGRQGLYRTLLVENRSMLLSDFKEVAESGDTAPPKDTDSETLERKFWKNIPLNPPLYGADVPGSLFDDRQRGWNIKRLSSLLSRTLEANGASIPGVTQPYLYAGSWRSFFAWHTEDMDLHSVNYLHYGAPKTWYVVPPHGRERFEQLLNGLLPDLFRYCPEFLRHKELLLSPALLAMHSIPLVKLEHHVREFVVVGPGAYHAGFNHGFNLAESVNFATKSWVPIGARAGFCCCRGDSVKIDMRLFLEYMPPDLRAEVIDSYENSDDEADEEEIDEVSGEDAIDSGDEENEENEESDPESEENSAYTHSNDENASPQQMFSTKARSLRPARLLKPSAKRREQMEVVAPPEKRRTQPQHRIIPRKSSQQVKVVTDDLVDLPRRRPKRNTRPPARRIEANIETPPGKRRAPPKRRLSEDFPKFQNSPAKRVKSAFGAEGDCYKGLSRPLRRGAGNRLFEILGGLVPALKGGSGR